MRRIAIRETIWLSSTSVSCPLLQGGSHNPILGISVLLIGVSAGQLSGTSVLGPLLELVFHPFMELLLVFALPVYVYLSFRKNAGLFLGDFFRGASLYFSISATFSAFLEAVEGITFSTRSYWVFFVTTRQQFNFYFHSTSLSTSSQGTSPQNFHPNCTHF